MPATSQAMRRAAAIAEHNPSQLYARNRGMLKMSKSQLRDYAATPEKGLPKNKQKAKGGKWSDRMRKHAHDKAFAG